MSNSTDRKSVFDLVHEISDYGPVYSALGLSDIVNSSKPDKMVPCPKSPDSNKSTKFRMEKDFTWTGKCIHNDVNNGHYMDIIEFTRWYRDISNPVDAAMEVLDAAGIEYVDYRQGGAVRNAGSTVPTISPEEIARRNKIRVDEGLQAIDNIGKAWNQSLPITNPQARDLLNKYLVSRGLPDGHVDLMPRHLRVNMNAYYPASLRKEDKGAWYAAWILPVLDANGKRCTLHRHYFQKETGQKIEEDKRKLMMSPPWSLKPGSQIEYDKPLIFEGGDGQRYATIAIGEGAETMEAVRAVMEISVQPMYSSSLLQGYMPPEIPGIPPERVLLDFYVDKDKPKPSDPQGRGAGEISVDLAIERLSALGYNCEKYLPPMDIPDGEKGVDWLDVLLTLGPPAFPS